MTVTHSTLIRLRDRHTMTSTSRVVKYSMMANNIVHIICGGVPNHETKAHCDHYNELLKNNIHKKFNVSELR